MKTLEQIHEQLAKDYLKEHPRSSPESAVRATADQAFSRYVEQLDKVQEAEADTILRTGSEGGLDHD